MSGNKNGLNIGIKSFVTAIVIIFILMIITYALTLAIPGGSYARVTDENGNTVIDTSKGFTDEEGGIPFYKWILSPILVLGASGSGTLIAVIIFLLVIGAVFNALENCGLMRYMLEKIVSRFKGVRYRLMALITFFFMALGALIGSFEECVPLVPIVVALSISLGWDTLVGISMSLLSVGCGFASGVCNPFTVGVAQELAGLPMFSGVSMRLLSFALIYALLLGFIYFYAKRIEKPILNDAEHTYEKRPEMDRALICFSTVMGIGILIIISSGFITALQDYTMIIVAVMFLIAGISSTLVSKMSGSKLLGAAFGGVLEMLPAVLMILMASSIKYTLEEANILDRILHEAISVAKHLPPAAVIIFIYLIVLVMNFFIPSGSAKAFMLIPLIVPMAEVFGISAQLCILAFAFGDGFSNVFYPTNPALLISLGIAETPYSKWFKHSWKFQVANLLLTSLLLLLGLAIGY